MTTPRFLPSDFRRKKRSFVDEDGLDEECLDILLSEEPLVFPDEPEEDAPPMLDEDGDPLDENGNPIY